MVRREDGTVYIRDSQTLPEVICLSGFGPKIFREINRQLRHTRQLGPTEHMAIVTSAENSFTSMSDACLLRLLSCGHAFHGPGVYGISTFARDWTHSDLPGVAIIETTRRVHGQLPTRGPTVLFFPGKLDMMGIVTFIGSMSVSANRSALNHFLPAPLAGLTLDYLAIDGFESWLKNAAEACAGH